MAMAKLITVRKFAEKHGLYHRSAARWPWRYHIEVMAKRPSLGKAGGVAHLYAEEDLERIRLAIEERRKNQRRLNCLRIRCSHDLMMRTKEAAREKGITTSTLVRVAVINYIKQF